MFFKAKERFTKKRIIVRLEVNSTYTVSSNNFPLSIPPIHVQYLLPYDR